MTVDVGIGKFSDAVGNFNTAASNTLTYTVDSTAPTVSLVGVPASASTISGGKVVAVTVTLSESSTDFTSGDVTLSN